MTNLQLTFACESYSHMRALADGSVRADGIDLTTLNLFPADTFPRLIRDREFEVAEMGLTFYLATLAADDPPFIAIPVFPSRSFRHSAIYVSTESGIEQPRDLAGKRIGETFCYGHDAGLWARGLMSDEYGVAPAASTYFIGGLDHPLPKWDWLPFSPPDDVEIHSLPPGKVLGAMLECGEIDALYSAHPPAALASGTRVRRLFEDFEPVERSYFARTGIFPIMHTIVIRRDVYNAHPWVATALYRAFKESKATVERLYAYWETSLHRLLMIPWVTELRRKNREQMGDDCWPYGVESNRKALETAIRYHVEQGLSSRRFAAEELFAAETIGD
jgi:hypothetical protein